MLKTPISKRAKLNRLALLAEKVKKRTSEPADQLLLKFQRIQQGLKVAIASLNPDIDFDDQTEALSPLGLEMNKSLNNMEKPCQKPKLSEILEIESGVDEALLECMQRLTRISHGLKAKALREGVFI